MNKSKTHQFIELTVFLLLFLITSSALAQDSDNDGLSDDYENTIGTDVSNFDTDNDGMPDGWEVLNNTDPLIDDSGGDVDGDGVENLKEYNVEATGVAETPNNIAIVSVNDDGVGNGSPSYSGNLEYSISNDGRYAAFASKDSTLVSNDRNSYYDVFVRDLSNNQTTLASVAHVDSNDGLWISGESGNGTSKEPEISANGRYVIFESFVRNLVPNIVTSSNNIFRYDIENKTTELVSITPSGTSGNDDSYEPLVSADGRYVAFVSQATDLEASPNTYPAGCGTASKPYNMFVRDMQTGITTLVSKNITAVDRDCNSGGVGGGFSMISPNGQFIVYLSNYSDSVPNDNNSKYDTLVYNMQTGTNTLVSINHAGTDSADDHSYGGVISDDGRYVAFRSRATDLIPNFSLNYDTDKDNIYLRDLQSGITKLVSHIFNDNDIGASYSYQPDISLDGRYVAYNSYAPELVSNNSAAVSNIYIYDSLTNTNKLVSTNNTKTNRANGWSCCPKISDDGKQIAYFSTATDLTFDTINSSSSTPYNVFHYNNNDDKTLLVSNNYSLSGSGDDISLYPRLTGDGRRVIFISIATDLVTTDTNEAFDSFVWTRNDSPVAVDDNDLAIEDMPINIAVLANDSDPDDDILAVAAIGLPFHGIATINPDSQSVTYTPNANFNGNDSFVYAVSDGYGGYGYGTVNVTVTPVNDAPTAVDDRAATNEDDPVTIAVIANDSDVDGDDLVISSFNPPNNGSVFTSADNKSITYTRAGNFTGHDPFTYTVSDGNGGFDTATVNVTVTSPSDTDGDGLADAWEQATFGTLAVGAGGDYDEDGVSNQQHYYYSLADGDINVDGVVDVADLLLAQRIMTNQLEPTAEQFLHGDIAPLNGNIPAPDSVIDVADVLVLQRIIMGQITLGTAGVVANMQAPVLDPVSLPVNTNPLPMSGTADPGVYVNIYVNGLHTETVTADAATGAFSFLAELKEGTNNIYAIATNGIYASAPSAVSSFDLELVWYLGNSKGVELGIDINLTPSELAVLQQCTAANNCLQNAVDVGALYFSVEDTVEGEFIAYYNENGNLVSVTENAVHPGGTLPSDPPPDPAPGVVGTLPGDFTVTPSGAASYVIPIEIPPGTNGVQPELSLVYDSQAGNGVLGVGWSIGGISQITRCPKNRAIDGVTGSINYDSNDRFCLDGQRLILTSGTYGYAGSTYRTEIDSQQIITVTSAVNNNNSLGPAEFEVETPGGTIMTYGYVEGIYDSRLEANLNGLFNTETVYKWALGKVEDINGNYYKLAYQQDGTINLPYVAIGLHYEQGNSVTRIDYTGNVAQGVVPYASVEFIYEDRTGYDIAHFIGSSGEVIKDRLKTIRTKVDGIQVKEYRLTYQTESTTGQERINSIRECAPTSCKPATGFAWQNGTNSLANQTWSGRNTGWQGADYYTLSGDFNGDGKTDIFSPHWPYGQTQARMRISTGNGFSKQIWQTTSGVPFSYESHENTNGMLTGDFNGDGLTDIAGYTNARQLVVHRSTSSGFNSAVWATMPFQPDIVNYYWSGDFDGDGRTDIAAMYADKVYVYLSRGTYFQQAIWDSYYPGTGYTFTGDYNGDGLTDIAFASGQVLISTGSNFVKQTWLTDWGPNLSTTYTGDFNGDGLTDIATVYNKTTQITLRMSTGKSFLKYTWDSTYEWTYKIFVDDFNGDGMSDIAGVFAGNLTMHLSTGTGFTIAQWPVSNNWEPGDGARYTGAGDFNGDGLADIYTYNGQEAPSIDSNIHIKLSTGSVPNLMTSATNGLGNTSRVYYTPLTNNTYYTKGTSAYPTLSVQSAMQVVRQKRTPDGLGGNTITNYTYEKYRVNLGGRGPLSFKRTTSNNLKTGLETIVDYNHTFPYIGMVQREDQLLDGYLISRNDKTPANWPTNRTGGVTRIPYIANDIVKSYDPFDSTNTVIKSVETITSLYNDSTGNIQNTTVKSTEPGNTDEYITFTSYLYESPGSAHCDQYLPTTISTYKTGPQGTTPTAVQQLGYNNCQLKTETGSVNGKNGLTKVHSYDNFGHVNQTTISGLDIAIRSVSTLYDTRGRFPFRVTNEFGHVVETQSDTRFGGITSSIDANGLQTSWQYDEFGQLIEQNNPDNSRIVTQRYWCSFGCSVEPLKSGLNTESALFIVQKEFYGGPGSSERIAPDVKGYYDILGREIRTETANADGRLIYADTNYDALGRAVASSQPYYSNAPWDKNPSTTAYDDLNRPVTQTSPDGGSVAIVYNGFNVTYNSTVVDPVTSASTVQTRTEINNFIGQNIETIDDQGNVIYREFDAQGNNVRILRPSLNPDGTVLDAKGTVTSFVYDDFGRKTTMTDPDMGTWSYTYNSLSELRTQTDAEDQTTTMSYDLMGRMAKRTDYDGTVTRWHYNDNLNAGDNPATMAIGKLDSVAMLTGTSGEFYRKSYEYEASVGLPVRTTETIEGDSYTTETTYDSYYRPEILSYPETDTGIKLQVKNVYDAAGVLQSVTSLTGAISYWRADQRDGANRVLQSTLGNNAVNWRAYDEAGRTTVVSSGDGNNNTIYNGIYSYDTMGNLRTRNETRGANPSVSYEYSYDSLNRLTTVTTDDVTTLTNSYDVLGNIRSKSDVGSYSYESTRPHAVTTAAGKSYDYDNNGSLSSSTDTLVQWSPFNKPWSIDRVSGATTEYSSQFSYGHDRARYKRVDYDFVGGTTRTTTYVSGIYEKVVGAGTAWHKYYIRGGEGVIATYTVTDDGASISHKTEYLHRDYQGSVVAVSDSTGAVIAQLGFDTFGQRKETTAGGGIDPIVNEVNRGYTGHEHLDGVGLVHMNGRVYSPVIGRFLSADPIVQAPNNLQSYNRYSYVFNNPMSYTDPSGYRSLRGHLRRIGKLGGQAIHNSMRYSPAGAVAYSKPVKRFMLKHEWARQAGQVAAGAADIFLQCSGACSAAYNAYLTDISGGSYADIGKSAGISYASYMAFDIVDAPYKNIKGMQKFTLSQMTRRTLAHGAIGGVVSEMSGGEFSKGFKMSAGTALLAMTAQNMRAEMLKQSSLNEFNLRGKSVGFKGDGYKLGGGRWVEGLLENQQIPSPLGGIQGGPGEIFGFDYSAGGFADYAVEAFAGPHDYFNNAVGWYNPSTSNAYNYTGLTKYIGEIYNAINIGIASPFVAASVIAPHTVTYINNEY